MSRNRRATTSPRCSTARSCARATRVPRQLLAARGRAAGSGSCARSISRCRACSVPKARPARNIQTEPLAMLNVDSRGNVSSFSPELLGLHNAQYADFLLGNINTDSLAEIHEPAFARHCSATSRGRRGVRGESCEYFSVCGGGAPVNKLFENGSFAGTRTSYLHADTNGADRSDPGSIRPARTELDDKDADGASMPGLPGRRPHRRATTEGVMTDETARSAACRCRRCRRAPVVRPSARKRRPAGGQPPRRPPGGARPFRRGPPPGAPEGPLCLSWW